MVKGYSIDCRYVVRVSELMKNINLPAPRKRTKFLINDGEILPIISVSCEI